ncbi:MAG: cell envelope integrity protein CreD [Caulobacterales bacterium]|nr:cell envelope integrity protein CreD [Caulobacterales bacterium]
MADTNALKLPFPRRSLGLKLLLVCGLALLMSIPALMVFGLLIDRSNRAETVATEVGSLMGGPQTFLGPVIAVPYTLTRPAQGNQPAQTSQSVWIVYPETGAMTVDTDSEVRKRSLFRVPVYEANLAYSASFDLAEAGDEAPSGAVLDWSRAELIVGAAGVRGARSDLTLVVAGRDAVALEPANLLSTLTLDNAGADYSEAMAQYGSPQLGLFSTPLGEVDRTDGLIAVTGEARFSGAQRIAVLAFARTTTAQMSGDWPDPSYGGGFLPQEQGPPASGSGFQAQWAVPYVARGVPSEGGTDTLARLRSTELAVSFVEPANPYQSVSRSLKYAPMFIGLVFLAYFLFETTTGKRVHPAQYILVGMAQVIFYMLLLSIAEHTGFDIAFGIAATATVALISAYAGWTFKSRGQGMRALVAFAFLYGLIYVLMRLEDYALLVGALASFAAIAAVMWFTRNVDWYGGKGGDDAPAST